MADLLIGPVRSNRIMKRSTNGKSHPADKMLPIERAHQRIVWEMFIDGKWVREDKGDTPIGTRKEFKRRHKKKSRTYNKHVVTEQISDFRV